MAPPEDSKHPGEKESPASPEGTEGRGTEGSSEAPETKSEKPEATESTRGGWLAQMGTDILAQLLPLVVSVGGLAALVFGVGAAVSTARFYGAGLPAQQAVNAATESDVEAVGLTWLVTFGLLGLLAVVLAYLASPQGEATAAMYYLLIGLATLEATVVWAFGTNGELWGDLWARDIIAGSVLLAAAAGAVAVVVVIHRRQRRKVAKEKAAEAKEASEQAAKENVAEKEIQQRKAQERAAQEREAEEQDAFLARSLKNPARDRNEKSDEPPLVLPIWAYAALAAISVAAGAAAGALLGEWWAALSIVFAGLLGLATIRVADLCGNFRWYGVCVFFSVGLFGAVLGVLRMLEDPRLQPVAFLHTRGEHVRAMQAVYVGESDDRFWFASVAVDECGEVDVRRGSGRLRSLPANEVSHVSIGPPMGLPKLAHESQAMLDDVMAEHHGRELVVGPGAVRDAVALEGLGRVRKASGRWVHLGSREDLGAHPQVVLNGSRLRLRRAIEKGERIDGWDVRLPRIAATGPVYVDCGERTNRAWLNVPTRPYALPTATYQGDGSWELDARGSFDPDGRIRKYFWKVGNRTEPGRRLRLSEAQYQPEVTLLVRDDARVPVEEGKSRSLEDDRGVRLDGTVSRAFPSDLLFCFDCRRLTAAGKRRVRALRHDAVGALRIVVRAHTDQRGGKAHNKSLSRAQARAVAKTLLAGMEQRPKTRVQGIGEEVLSDPGDHRQNRRVEVIIHRQADAG